MTPTALPATSIVAPTALPAIDIGAVTICVHPENKSKVIKSVSVNLFMNRV